MITRMIFCATLIFSAAISGQNISAETPKDDAVIAAFMQLSHQKLYDTAHYYLSKNSLDSALICYNLVINTATSSAIDQQKRAINAYNRIGHIYATMSEYRNAYKHYIDAIMLCEKYQIETEQYKIYNNIGNIYYYFKRGDIAKTYYKKSLSSNPHKEDKFVDMVYNNLGVIELDSKNLDSAYYYLNKGLQINKRDNTKRNNTNALPLILDNIGLYFYKTKQYDSAYYYYQLSVKEAQKNNNPSSEAITYGKLSILFDELNNRDSVLYYLDLSKTIASENNFLNVLADVYRSLSKLEEKQGKTQKAFDYYKKYSALKDSLFNTNTFGNINQLQRFYEVSKTNQQIEQLIIEQQIKEQTIRYKNIIWYITLAVLGLVAIGLTFFVFQNRKLKKAYNVLVDKNMEIIKLNEKVIENSDTDIIEIDYNIDIDTDIEKITESLSENNVEPINSEDDDNDDNTKTTKKIYKKLSEKESKKLLAKILKVMDNTAVICNYNFSIDELAEQTKSNYVYVSHVINNVIKDNFRTFLNKYRIKEAQRLFSVSSAEKFTIEFYANKVGYKSRNTFNEAFKEITGVTPKHYLNTMREPSVPKPLVNKNNDNNPLYTPQSDNDTQLQKEEGI